MFKNMRIEQNVGSVLSAGHIKTMGKVRKYAFDLVVWWCFYGYMPTEKAACREWLQKNLKNNVLPFVQWTETKVDDNALAIVQLVVDNNTLWDVVWERFHGNEPFPDTIIDGSENERTGLLQRIRSRIGRQRYPNATESVAILQSSDEEAESVALVSVILCIIANGPLAFSNVKALIQRIRNRKNGR